MNYLGHLYLSGNNPQLMLANLFGDFVKGRDYSHLPLFIKEGVSLHRSIDDFTDTHPIVTELRLELYQELPKIAGIAIDLYFDHLLADNWHHFHPKPLHEYVDDFFNAATLEIANVYEKEGFKFPDRFIHLITIMNEQNWIKRYKNMEGLTMASTGLSKRISFPNNLDEASEVFLQYQNDIKSTFELFMNDAQIRFNI